MIVVIGSPFAREVNGGATTAAGLAPGIAVAAAGAGARVELVGKVGEDPAGEEVLLDLARQGVRHVAVQRDPARPTLTVRAATSDDEAVDVEAPADDATFPATAASTLDAADLQLALRYLPEYSTIVVADRLHADALGVVLDAAAWAGAALVLVGEPGAGVDLPEGVTVFAAPSDGDPDGAFAAIVGTYTAGIDRGDDPKAAFAIATAAVGSTAAD